MGKKKAVGRSLGGRTRMPSSRVIQAHISSIGSAASYFAHHENLKAQPIVLVPTSPCCCTCCFTVPSGFWILRQDWTCSRGEQPPGFHFFWPFWNRISHIVTKKAISYDHPVAHCPTSDNVMVEVNCAVTFQIGPTAADAERFVYTLGAVEFDKLLSALMDEAVRALVNRTPLLRVVDMKGELAGSITDELMTVLTQYGVVIRHVAITDVLLPEKVETLLMSRTSFETQIKQDAFVHASRMLDINNDAAIKLLEIDRHNWRAGEELRKQTEEAKVRHVELSTTNKMEKQLAIINSTTDAQVAQIRAESGLENANNVAERNEIEMLLRTKAGTEAAKIVAEQKYNSAVIRTQAALELAKSQADAVTAIATVEQKSAVALQEMREFELKNYKMVMLKEVSTDSQMVICGDLGEDMLSLLVPGGTGDLTAR